MGNPASFRLGGSGITYAARCLNISARRMRLSVAGKFEVGARVEVEIHSQNILFDGFFAEGIIRTCGTRSGDPTSELGVEFTEVR